MRRSNIATVLMLLLACGWCHAAETQAASNPDATPPVAPATHLSASRGSDRLDLGAGVSLELVSIPAGSFQMGATEKVPESPWIGLGLLLGAAGVITILGLVIGLRAVIAGERPRFSLAVLLVGTLSFGVAMLGLLRWRRSVADLSASNAQPNERPTHAVTLTKGFQMGRFCITQQQFERVMRVNYSFFKAPDKPAENVNWDEAQEFCSRASTLTGRTVRLPTEAEWEYACRAGTHSLYYNGDDPKELFKVAWFAENSKNATHSDDETLKSLKPNAWGLFDMHGNVMEWCQDWYDDAYYAKSPAQDPTGPATGSFRVVRGSAWLDGAANCRASNRNGFAPGKRSYCVGFRVVVEN